MMPLHAVARRGVGLDQRRRLPRDSIFVAGASVNQVGITALTFTSEIRIQLSVFWIQWDSAEGDDALPDSRSMPTAKGRRHRPPSRRHRSMPTAAVGIDPSA